MTLAAFGRTGQKWFNRPIVIAPGLGSQSERGPDWVLARALRWGWLVVAGAGARSCLVGCHGQDRLITVGGGAQKDRSSSGTSRSHSGSASVDGPPLWQR